MEKEVLPVLRVFRDSLALQACLDLLVPREDEGFQDPRAIKETLALLVDLESLDLLA